MTSPGSRVARRAAHGRRIVAALAAVAGLALVAGCGSSSSTGLTGASEVQAQAVNTAGSNPFTASVGQDHPGVTPPAGAASSSGGPASYKGDLPGLYGGTRNMSSCDAKKLVSFLMQNPSKAAAWASTLGIRSDQISDYVSHLTNVLLRTDTRVTNHGYVNGQANAFQAVLEAGTAVFVDQNGQPVVKCYCGNPLTPPTLLSAPAYTGPTWSGFSTSSITIIQQSITIIQTFTLYDPNTGMLFPRGAGEGGKDGPYQGTGTTGGQGTSGAQGSGSASENPSVSFSANPVTAGATETVTASGFTPNASLTMTINRPDGGVETYNLQADSSGTASQTFTGAGGSETGTYNVTVKNNQSGASASGSVQVVPASGPSSPSPPTPGTPTQ